MPKLIQRPDELYVRLARALNIPKESLGFFAQPEKVLKYFFSTPEQRVLAFLVHASAVSDVWLDLSDLEVCLEPDEIKEIEASLSSLEKRGFIKIGEAPIRRLDITDDKGNSLFESAIDRELAPKIALASDSKYRALVDKAYEAYIAAADFYTATLVEGVYKNVVKCFDLAEASPSSTFTSMQIGRLWHNLYSLAYQYMVASDAEVSAAQTARLVKAMKSVSRDQVIAIFVDYLMTANHLKGGKMPTIGLFLSMLDGVRASIIGGAKPKAEVPVNRLVGRAPLVVGNRYLPPPKKL